MAPEEAAIHKFLLEAFAAGTEGLMLKVLDGPKSCYAPSKRSEAWLKIKKCARIARAVPPVSAAFFNS